MGLLDLCSRSWAYEYFNVYGPRQRPDSIYAAVIPAFINAMIDGLPPTIFGHGKPKRNFVNVDDAVRANLLAAENDAAAGNRLNISGAGAVTTNEQARILQEIIPNVPAPIYGPPRDVDICFSEAVIERAWVALGYRPEVALVEGLRSTVEWFRQARLQTPPMKPRIRIRNRTILLGDLLLIVTAVLASYALRLELGEAFAFYLPTAWVMVAVALLVKPVVYYFFGLYRRYWVYASVRELRIIAVAVVTASVIVALVLLLVASLGGLAPGFPRAVIGIDLVLSLLAVGGLRLTVRLLAESGQISQRGKGNGRPREMVVVGAGDAGVLVVREMQRNPQLNMRPVAFVDDDPEKLKKDIHGVRVAGSLADLERVLHRYL